MSAGLWHKPMARAIHIRGFPVAGTHALQVWVQSSGSSASYEAWLGTGNFTVLAPTARLTSFSSNVAFPAPFNVPITFTAAATAGSASVEYKFWRFRRQRRAGQWRRDYSSTNTYTWYPPQGSNAVQVWVRAVGSTASYQDWMSTGLFDVVVAAAAVGDDPGERRIPGGPYEHDHVDSDSLGRDRATRVQVLSLDQAQSAGRVCGIGTRAIRRAGRQVPRAWASTRCRSGSGPSDRT